MADGQQVNRVLVGPTCLWYIQNVTGCSRVLPASACKAAACMWGCMAICMHAHCSMPFACMHACMALCMHAALCPLPASPCRLLSEVLSLVMQTPAAEWAQQLRAQQLRALTYHEEQERDLSRRLAESIAQQQQALLVLQALSQRRHQVNLGTECRTVPPPPLKPSPLAAMGPPLRGPQRTPPPPPEASYCVQSAHACCAR